MRHMSIDIETYSNTDIASSGLYKYAQDPAFEIMLIAYSIDFGPVILLDLMNNDSVSQEFCELLKDENVIKHAYNAAFEWYCFNQAGFYTPIEQWQCTMFHGLYCGYTAGLSATGKALGLPEDKQKLVTGKALIKTFCVPCKPSKSNGNRTRTLPHHEPEKWELFKQYCIQDVVTEMAIENKFSNFPVIDEEQKLWQIDILINETGIAIDKALVSGALEIDEAITEELTKEAKLITGLANPNSATQLSKWIEAQTGQEVENMQKDTVSEMLKDIENEKVKRALEIRQELSKTSTKKYVAMAEALCPDGRVRGLLQFYGANRTGRWCLTGDHEILTSTGWTRLDGWTGGLIACWEPSTEAVSFQKAKSVSFDYKGYMYELESKRISQISTPDHKMPYLGKNGIWESDTVENLANKRFVIPFNGRRNTQPCLEHTELRILIMTQADGHYTETGDLRFHFSKQRKIERCKHLLRKAGVNFQVGQDLKSSTITIKSRALPIWLRTFRDKTFGMWLLDESPDIVFDELEFWDGYRCGPASIQYSSTNKQNADIIQALAHISGRTANILVKHRDKDNWNDCYVVNIWLKPGKGNEIREKATKSYFEGKVYCAQTKTGFFLVRRNGKVWITGNSGRLVQVQNLPRNYLESLDHARQTVKAKNIDALKIVYGNVPDTLSQLIRTAFIPSQGNKLVVADFSAIEARVIAWLAEEQWRQEVFATHGKIYEASASQMFGVPIEHIVKDRPEYALRQKGKVAELALGYQGGAGALVSMGALNMGLSEEELPDIVRRWRESNKRIVDLWYSMENAVLRVMRTGESVGIKGMIISREVDFVNSLDFLTITLHSGRKLFYPKPFLASNNFDKEALHYNSLNQTTKKWEVTGTYGGKLVENVIQAIARDCLAESIKRVHDLGHKIVMHVHDEIVLDAPTDVKVEDICSIMGEPISWAPELILKAAGFEAEYYMKD